MIALESSEAQFVERITQAARAGGASELDVATLRQMVEHRHEFSTLQLALRVRALEEQLCAMDAGERRDAITSRLNLSVSRYYELRKIATSTAPDRTGNG